MPEVSESGLNDDIEDTADLTPEIDFKLTMTRLSGIPCPQ
jgi:hypothetical protein